MRLFEDPLDTIFTLGPAQVLRVEEREVFQGFKSIRREPVVIYMAKQRAAPVERGGHWVMPDDAMETRFVMVPAETDGGCEIPPNAGRPLGHFRREGRRWWVFLEKLAPDSKGEAPGADVRKKSAAQSRVAPKASGAPSVPAQRAPQPSSRPSASPGSNQGRS